MTTRPAPCSAASRLALVAVAAVALLGGCRRSAPAGDESTAPAPSASGAAPLASAPVDHLAPGELLEGSEVAFGLRLPRDLRVDEKFGDAVVASGPPPVHSLVQYFRPRLQEGGLREGESSATFEHVKVPGQPGQELTLHILPVPGGTRVEIHDVTPRVAAPLPDERARWNKVGLTPEGRLADPTHLD